MVSSISLFSVYLAPIIALIAWVISLVRLRSWVLAGATLLVAVFVLITTFNIVVVLFGNPYVMSLLMVLALFNVLFLPYSDERDKQYMIMANLVLLVMIGALHGWNIYLRQSDLYFYELSDYGQVVFPILISILSLAIPILAYVARPSKANAWRWALAIIVVGIGLAFVLGFLV